MDPALWEILRTSSGRDGEEVEAIIRLDQPHIAVPGLRIVSRFGPIATCRLKRDSIITTREEENVLSLKAARILVPEAEPQDSEVIRALPLSSVDGDIRRPPGLPLTGTGVVIGLADWGCDFDHPHFKNTNGSTRISALWDQRGQYSPDVDNPYGYGTVYSREQINRALRHADPYTALGYHPADADPGGFGTHGTHVMDIAAGNGLGGGPVGLAPEADLIFVHLANRGTSGLANLGDSVRILEAVDFIARNAGDRPWVVNLSVGNHGGPHDGSTLAEMAFDFALRAAPGRFIVQSTGNYFDKRIHASGRLREGQERTLSLIVDEADYTPNELEIWYAGEDQFAIQVESPFGSLSPWVRLGEDVELIENNRIVGRIYNRASDPNNLDNHADIFLYPDAPPGQWQVTIRAQAVKNGVFHAWLERDEVCAECQTHFSKSDSDKFYTTGTLANGRIPLVVGAYNAHSLSREVAPFSSVGPTRRENRPKPDLVAPGVGVLAARSAPPSLHKNPGMLVRKSGTSMAAPHVTGAVALCLQGAQRPLWSHEIRELILRNTQPAAQDRQPSLRYGRGYLDVVRVVDAVLALPSQISSVTYHLPGAEENLYGWKEIEMKRNMDVEARACLPLKSAETNEVGDVKQTLTKSYQLPHQLLSFGVKKYQSDLVYWFAQLYYYITDAEITQRSRFQYPAFTLHFIPIFYDMYAQNANHFLKLEYSKMTPQWRDHFSIASSRVDPSQLLPYVEQATKSIVSGVKAHIQGDMPLALARAYQSFASKYCNVPDFDTFRDDFFAKNRSIFKQVQLTFLNDFLNRGLGVFMGFRRGIQPKTAIELARKTKLGLDIDEIYKWREDAWEKAKTIIAKANNNGKYPSSEALQISEVHLESAPHYFDLAEDARVGLKSDEDIFQIEQTVKPNLSTYFDRVEQAINGSTSRSDSERDLLTAILRTNGTWLPANFLDPDLLYRAILFGRSKPLSKMIDDCFTVLARPGESPKVLPQAGDILVRVALGEPGLGHVAVLSDSRLWPEDELGNAPFESEHSQPGFYATVIESGTLHHGVSSPYARRILDPGGKMPPGQLLLGSNSYLDIEEGGGGLEYDQILNRIRQELALRFKDPDDPELFQRRRRLRALFESVPRPRARELHARLGERPIGDELSQLFHGRLATATRRELLGILEKQFAVSPCRREMGSTTLLLPWERSLLAVVHGKSEADFKGVAILIGPVILPGLMAWPQDAIVKAALKNNYAITIENNIWFPQAIDTSTVDDLTWLVHESVHVVDYALAGTEAFLKSYAQQASVSGFTHDDIPYEARANRIEKAVKRMLTRFPELVRTMSSCDGSAIMALLERQKDVYRLAFNESMGEEETEQGPAEPYRISETNEGEATTLDKQLVEAPTVSPSSATPAKLPDSRMLSQQTRLELIRGMQWELASEFTLIDAALPETRAYKAYKQVREHVMADIITALNNANDKLKGANPTTDAGAIQSKLEQAELWLFFMPIYAVLGALIRAAEIDRLIPNVIVEVAGEAHAYEWAFSLINDGKQQSLIFARENAIKQAENTKRLLTVLDTAIKKGEHAVASAKQVEAILDVPIQFASGATLPPQWLFLIFAVDKAGFYRAHIKQLDILTHRGYDFLAELAWLEVNAPLSRTHILNPIYVAIGKDAVKSITAADVAFILGRMIYNIKKSAGKLTWQIAMKALTKATIIVGILDSPKLAVHGIEKLATRTKESVLQAIGGPTDPHEIIKEINEKLESNLSPSEVSALLLELTTPPVEDHVKLLTAAGADISPNIAAILADLEETGRATSTTIAAAQAIAFPLLPPAP